MAKRSTRKQTVENSALSASVSFSQALELTLHRSLQYASDRKHEFATLEHLLLAIADDPDAQEVLIGCGANVAGLKADLISYLDKEYAALSTDGAGDPTPTAGFQRVVQRAILHVQSSGKREVNGRNILISLFSERDTFAVHYLHKQDISRLDAVAYDASLTESNQRPDFSEFDFFISYANEDIAVAEEIDAVLRAAGFSTVVQFRDFGPGSNFVREMQDALRNALRVIAVYSPDYENSAHCQAEWAAAYNLDPDGKKGKLVPFLVRPTHLNPLARQIVYTSLVGLKAAQRSLAILKAVTGQKKWSDFQPADSLEDALSRVSSPFVQTKGQAFDIAPNPDYDRVVDFPETAETISTLITVGTIISGSLPRNAPPVVGLCFESYVDHITQRPEAPIIGILASLAVAIEREYASVEVDIWGAGLEQLITDFLSEHGRLLSCISGADDREKLYGSIALDEAMATSDSVVGPLVEAEDAFQKLSEDGLTTPEFDQFIEKQNEIVKDVAAGPMHGSSVTIMKRIIVASIGFYKKFIEIASSTVALADSPSVILAISTLKRVIKELLELIK